MSAKKNLLTKREKEMKKIHIYFNRFPQIFTYLRTIKALPKNWT